MDRITATTGTATSRSSSAAARVHRDTRAQRAADEPPHVSPAPRTTLGISGELRFGRLRVGLISGAFAASLEQRLGDPRPDQPQEAVGAGRGRGRGVLIRRRFAVASPRSPSTGGLGFTASSAARDVGGEAPAPRTPPWGRPRRRLLLDRGLLLQPAQRIADARIGIFLGGGRRVAGCGPIRPGSVTRARRFPRARMSSPVSGGRPAPSTMPSVSCAEVRPSGRHGPVGDPQLIVKELTKLEQAAVAGGAIKVSDDQHVVAGVMLDALGQHVVHPRDLGLQDLERLVAQAPDDQLDELAQRRQQSEPHGGIERHRIASAEPQDIGVLVEECAGEVGQDAAWVGDPIEPARVGIRPRTARGEHPCRQMVDDEAVVDDAREAAHDLHGGRGEVEMAHRKRREHAGAVRFCPDPQVCDRGHRMSGVPGERRSIGDEVVEVGRIEAILGSDVNVCRPASDEQLGRYRRPTSAGATTIKHSSDEPTPNARTLRAISTHASAASTNAAGTDSPAPTGAKATRAMSA